ncbi:lipopolysaccharide core heptose(I) kinase RfaP [Aurantivibrio plasticivorans]
MDVFLFEPFARAWADKDAFDEVANISGTVVRHKEGRKTQKFDFDGGQYYVKHHSGIGWGEYLKNLSQLKKPVIGARNEWEAINYLHQLGIHTLTPVAFGERGGNPAAQESFLITKELTDVYSLAKYTETWPQNPPSFLEKLYLINAVADIARKIHAAGINHRDLYICHFLLKLEGKDIRNPILHLVDLHRAQIRRQVPRRWLVKDLASIYFSAMDIGLTRRDVYRFLRAYFQQPLKAILAENEALLRSVEKRANRLYERDFSRSPDFSMLSSRSSL